MADPSTSNSSLIKWLGVLTILFGILFFASQTTELLTQLVIAPGTAAAAGAEADCRPDELEEEDLSLQECQLMVANVQMRLVSQPEWFRGLQLGISGLSTAGAVISVMFGIALISNRSQVLKPLAFVLTLLLLGDLISFVAVSVSGPLLRALYLEKLLVWFFIHLSLVLAAIANISQTRKGLADND